MSMKPLVKTFHSYLNEELSPEEQRDLVLKTIMRKRRFESPNPEIQI